MTDTNIVTVEDFQLLAPEVDLTKFSAPTISGVLSWASKQVSDYLEYTPLAEDIVAEIGLGRVTTDGDLYIYPQKIPIVRVDAIGLTKGTTTIALTLQANGLDKFNIDYNKRHIKFPAAEIAFNASPVVLDFYSLRYSNFYVKLSYRAGWEPSEIPGSIKQAAVLFAKDYFSGQHNQSGANRITQGALTLEFSNAQTGVTTESKLSTDAKRLLRPYRR